jgi:hypothetical protein
MDTGKAGVERAFRLAERLAREMQEEATATSSPGRSTSRGRTARGFLARERGSSRLPHHSADTHAGTTTAITVETPRVNSPWFVTLLGPPFLAECRWRWVFGPAGWEATHIQLRRGEEHWVELEWGMEDGCDYG